MIHKNRAALVSALARAQKKAASAMTAHTFWMLGALTKFAGYSPLAPIARHQMPTFKTLLKAVFRCSSPRLIAIRTGMAWLFHFLSESA
jgi:hypothetical protein